MPSGEVGRPAGGSEQVGDGPTHSRNFILRALAGSFSKCARSHIKKCLLGRRAAEVKIFVAVRT